MDAQFVVNKWKKFVKKNQELREMLLVQYRGTFIKILHNYREFKKRQFQNYIINNASKLIISTMKYHHFKYQNFNKMLGKFQVKRFYIHKSQQQLFQEITQLNCKSISLQVLRLELHKQPYYQSLLISTLKEPKNAIVIGNFHQMKLQFQETDKTQQVINYPFLYEFQNQVTVKRLQKQYKFSSNERYKYYQFLQKINKIQQEKYQQLCVVELTQLSQNALHMIQKYNKLNKASSIHIIVDYQLNRIIAACKIQKFFRAKLDVNKNGMTLDQITRLINQSRSIFVIQQWFRRMRQLHRMIFFKEIAYQAHIICSKSLYLDFETYENIENIINNQQFSLKFLEQYCAIVMDQTVVRLQLQIPKTDFFGQQTYLQQIQELRQYQSQLKIIPTWLLKQLQIVPLEDKINVGMDVLKQEESVRFQRKNRTQLKKIKQSLAVLQQVHKQGDIYNLLHVGASIEFEVINNRKYIKFIYASISEARYRAISIALLTYKFKQNGTYIWMISENIWEDVLYQKRSFLEQYYKKIEKIYKIEFNQQSSENVCLQKQSKPIILCQNIGEVQQFGTQHQQINLSFYDEVKKVDQQFYFLLNAEEIMKKSIIQSRDQINSTVYSPPKFSIYQLDPPQVKDKKKLYTFDTSVYILSSKYKSMQKTSPRQIDKIDISKKQEISYDNMTERISKYRYQNKTTKLKIDDCMKNINESYITDRRSIVSNLKQNTKRSEKTFESDFIMLTALVQRQERNVIDKIKNKQKNEVYSLQNNGNRQKDRSYSQKISSNAKTPSLNPKKIDRGTSFDEDSDRSKLVFPSINLKKQNRQTQKQRLSDYHRYAIFSEELYAIHNKNTNSDSIKY